MNKSEQQQQQMREFLGEVVTEVLSWGYVEGVSVRLVPHIGFEDDGMDGEVRLRLTSARAFGYLFQAYEVALTPEPTGLITHMKAKLEQAMENPVRVG